MKKHYKYFTLFLAAFIMLASCEDDVDSGNDTLSKVRLNAPTNVEANFNTSKPTDGEITLTWGGSEGAESYTVALYDGNVDINSVIPTVGEENCVSVQNGVIEPTLSYNGLSTDVVTYYAYVQATSSAADTINSSWTTVYFSPKYNAPIIPQATFVSAVSGQTVTIQWTLDSSVTPTQITASLDEVVIETKNLTTDDVENAEIIFEDLDPYSEYTFELLGNDSYGKTTALTYPIYEVTAVMESETNQNMLLTWNAADYPDFAAGTITYEPYNQDQEGEFAIDATVAIAGTATIADLKYGDMKYTFIIYIDGVEAGHAEGVTGIKTAGGATPVDNTANLADIIAAAESGTTFELGNGNYANTTGEIVIDKNITLKAADGATPMLEGVFFTLTDATLELDGITCQNTSGVSAFVTVEGSTAGLELKNSIFNNLSLSERFIQFTATTVKEFSVDNCVVSNIDAPSELMDFSGAVEILNITNSTFADCASGTTYFIDLNGDVGDVFVDANTFVNQTNRGIRSRNKAYASFTLTNNIYADFTGTDNRIIYSTSSDAPSISTNNFAYGYGDNRLVKEGMTELEVAPFSETPDENGIYTVTDGTSAGDPDGL
ncbi:MAG: DUF4957 domain-containing protein [Mangrovibacterium sp.]